MNRLEGKNAVVTGAGRGLGAAIAVLFAKEGARVLVADVDLSSAEQVVDQICAMGGEGTPVSADVTSADDVGRMMDALTDRYGRIDILVNNAGIASQGSVTDLPEEDWDRVMEVNIKGAYLCSRAAIPQMKEVGAGSIICVSSASGVIGQRDQVAYNVSKHALIGLVRCMALDHAAEGIRVNAVCPGVMNTPMLEALSDAQLADLYAMHPIGRIAEASEIAQTVLHLAGDEASFTTGAVFLVDGGLTAM